MNADYPVAVVPVLVGPLQALLAILPGILLALGGLVVTLFRWSTVKKIARLLWRKKVGVTITGAVVAGAVYGLRAVWPATGPRAGTAEAAVHPWPMFRGGPERRGAVPDSPDPVQGGINWAFTSECRMFYSSPCVVGNRLYVTSTDKGPLRDVGAIYCLDADNGAVVWQSRPKKYLATFSSPSVAGKYLVVGEGLHFTRNARIVCLDVTDKGRILWTYRTKSHVESSPCIDLERGRVYIGAGDDGYYCLALEPDQNGEARVLWHTPPEQYPDSETSPVVYEGRVYVGLGMGGQAICCLDGETGREVWRVAAPYPVFAPPTVADGKLFVGMGNGNFIESAEQVWAKEYKKMRDADRTPEEIEEAKKRFAPGGEVWCMDPATGRIEWQFKTDRVILSGIAAGDGRLYFATRGGKVYCISTAGSQLAPPWDARANVLASPALGAEHVYVVSQAGTLFVLAADTLQPVWETQLALKGQFIGSPTVGRGRVYVGTDEDGLLSVGEPRREVLDPIWPGRLGGPGRSGWADGSPVPENASLAWRFPEGETASDTHAVRTAVMSVHHALYVGVETAARTGLARLNLTEEAGRGALTQKEAWFRPTALPVSDTAALADAVYLVEGRPGEAGRRLLCLDAASGQERWNRPVADGASGRLFVTQHALFVVDRKDGLSRLIVRGKEAGSTQWTATVGSFGGASSSGTCVGGPVLTEEAMLVVAVALPAGGALVALDAETGQVLWAAPLAAAPATAPVYSQDILCVGSAEGLTAHSVVGGAQLWHAAVGAVEGDLVSDRERVAATVAPGMTSDPQGALVLVDWIDGHEVGRLEGVARGIPPVLLRDGLLYATAESIQRYDFQSRTSSRWMLTSWMGSVTAPVVLARSHGFVPTAQRGLVCARPRR